MRTRVFTEKVVAGEGSSVRMSIDNGLGEETPIECPTLTDQPALDHDNRRMPASFQKRSPPLRKPLPDIEFSWDSIQFVKQGVMDNISGQRAFSTGNLDPEGPPRTGPAIQNDFHGMIGHCSKTFVSIIPGQ